MRTILPKSVRQNVKELFLLVKNPQENNIYITGNHALVKCHGYEGMMWWEDGVLLYCLIRFGENDIL
jgi:hypothetical protein